MNFMFQVTVKNQYFGYDVQLPVGLSVIVANDSLINPLYTISGKKRIAEAFRLQCGLNLSENHSAISIIFMKAERI